MLRRGVIGLFTLLVSSACGEEPASQGNSAASGGNGNAGASGSGTGGSAGASYSSGSGTGGSNAGTSGGGEAGQPGDSGGAPNGDDGDCEPLPDPTGPTVEVTPEQSDELPSIVADAASGTTILLSDGTYTMTGADEGARRIQVTKPGITLRGASGNRDAVVIDGEYVTEEVITVSASDVTIADLTVMRAVTHPIHVTGGSSSDVTHVRLYNLKVLDGGEQFVKVNTSGATPNTYVDEGRLECSLLELTEEGRTHVATHTGGCYTGGIDGHQARGWVVRRNTFKNIYCENGGLAEHAIHFWTASRDTLVEQNTIIDCARGIGFGLGDGGGAEPNRAYADDPYPGIGYVGHYDGVIRNNVISTTFGLQYFDSGIELEQAHGARVLHNTVLHDTGFASISHRWPNTDVTLTNNLVVSIRGRDDSQAVLDANLEAAESDWFVDAAAHDLHLAASASGALDQASVVEDSGDDIDGEPHDTALPDIGADER